jgi:hypothetical protein
MTDTTTTTTTTETADAAGKISGEIVTWNIRRLRVAYRDVRAALAAAGLEESVAKEMLPRNAFTRAARRLAQARIIRKVTEDEDFFTFQMTKESLDAAAKLLTYDMEAVLTLNKRTGEVTGTDAALAAQARDRIADEMGHRGGGDVSAVIQRLFQRHADLFPVRDQGGCYFVAARHAAFTGKVDQFLLALTGRRLSRFPVQVGTPHGDASVNKAVAEGLEAMIAEHLEAVAAFGEDTQGFVLERAAQRIQQTRFKVEAYAEFLEGAKEKLQAQLAEATALLRSKVEAITAAEPVAA